MAVWAILLGVALTIGIIGYRWAVWLVRVAAPPATNSAAVVMQPPPNSSPVVALPTPSPQPSPVVPPDDSAGSIPIEQETEASRLSDEEAEEKLVQELHRRQE
ncbi:MAG: hypothetical protein Q7R60_02930 [bacterium]|nr:hypothetical protein [bacterium]